MHCKILKNVLFYSVPVLKKPPVQKRKYKNETFKTNDENNTHTLCHGLYDIYRTGFLVYKTGK